MGRVSFSCPSAPPSDFFAHLQAAALAGVKAACHDRIARRHRHAMNSLFDELDPKYRAILCDIWGVVHDGERILPGVEQEAIEMEGARGGASSW